MARVVPDLDLDHIRESYLAGESEKSIANRLGVGRAAIRRRLIAQGIAPRGRSEAMFVRMSRTDPDERGRLVAAAHVARRGAGVSLSEAHNKALARQMSGAKVGAGELLIADRLRELGHASVGQLAVGPYNLDLAVHPVAVEVHIDGSYPLNHGNRGHRLEYLLDAGWHVVYIWITQRYFLTDDGIRELAAFIERAKSAPPTIRQYGVIRGSGEHVAFGSRYFDNVAFVEAPIGSLD